MTDDDDDLPDITTTVRDVYEHVAAPRATFDLLDSLPNRALPVTAQSLSAFGPQAGQHIQRSDTWAMRFHGTGIGHDVVDLGQLAQISHDLDKTTTWISASLYPGHRHTAGAQAALTGHSIVVLLVPGVNETPIESNGELIYPSVEAGRYLASLFAAAGEPERLSDLLGPLSTNAKGAYVNQVRSMADAGFGAQAVVHVPGRDGDSATELRQVNLSPSLAEIERDVLTAPAKYKKDTDVVDGVFVGWDRDRRKFKLKRDDERGDYTGDFPEDLTDAVAAAQNRRVEITVSVENPVFSWMPRRARPQKMLTRVERLKTRRTFRSGRAAS